MLPVPSHTVHCDTGGADSASAGSSKKATAKQWEEFFKTQFPQKYDLIIAKGLRDINWKRLTINESIIANMRKHARSVGHQEETPQRMYIGDRYLAQATDKFAFSSINIRDLKKGKDLGTVNPAGLSQVYALFVDEESLFAGYEEGSIVIWDIESKRNSTIKTGICPIQLKAVGIHLYVHGEGNLLQIWDLNKLERITEIEDVKTLLNCNGNNILYINCRNEVVLRNTQENRTPFRASDSIIWCSSDYHFIDYKEGKITIWCLQTGDILHTVELTKKEKVTCLEFNDSHLVVGYKDGTLEFVSVEDTVLEHQFKGLYHQIESVKWNEKYLAAAGSKGIEIWDFNSGKLVRKIEHKSDKGTIIWHLDDIKLITQEKGEELLNVWDIETGKQLVLLSTNFYHLKLAYADERRVITCATPSQDDESRNLTYYEYDFAPRKKKSDDDTFAMANLIAAEAILGGGAI